VYRNWHCLPLMAFGFAGQGQRYLWPRCPPIHNDSGIQVVPLRGCQSQAVGWMGGCKILQFDGMVDRCACHSIESFGDLAPIVVVGGGGGGGGGMGRPDLLEMMFEMVPNWYSVEASFSPGGTVAWIVGRFGDIGTA